MKDFIPEEMSIAAQLVGMVVGMVMITVPYWYKKKDKTKPNRKG